MARTVKWGNPKTQKGQAELERKRRIVLSIAAYAYEFKDDPILSDADFDELALLIRPELSTKNRKMDNFFKKNFKPDTGMWIHKHPFKSHLDWLYSKFYEGKGEISITNLKEKNEDDETAKEATPE